MSEDPAGKAADRDELTGLPERALLREHLELGLARARESDREVALLRVGLDDFRLVNDSLGHAAGDEVLRQVARRVRDVVHPTNPVARAGGDEFCVMLADVRGDAERVAEMVAAQVTVALQEPFSVSGSEFELGASIGVSIYPQDALDAEALLKHAEAAMHEAKEAGRGALAVYAGGTLEALDRLTLPARLRKALERDEFVLHYQPIFRLRSDELVAVEALIRHRDPERGLVGPLEFVPIAEYTGLIEPIGEWVVDALAAQAQEWREQRLDVPVSFNVSLRQFQSPDFANSVNEKLAESGLDPASFTVEITESTAMREPQCVEPVLRELRESGIQIAIDDFGTGYSSLSRLQHLPVQTIKVDKAFLDGVPHDEEAARVVGATLHLVEALGMAAVVEGVETEEQRRFLLELGCPLAQGFHLAHPLPADELGRLLRGGAEPVSPTAR